MNNNCQFDIMWRRIPDALGDSFLEDKLDQIYIDDQSTKFETSKTSIRLRPILIFFCHLHQEVSDHGGGDLTHAGEDPDRPEHQEDAVPEPQDGEGLQGRAVI